MHEFQANFATAVPTQTLYYPLYQGSEAGKSMLYKAWYKEALYGFLRALANFLVSLSVWLLRGCPMGSHKVL